MPLGGAEVLTSLCADCGRPLCSWLLSTRNERGEIQKPKPMPGQIVEYKKVFNYRAGDEVYITIFCPYYEKNAIC